jgi:AraC-like DNA-binding protein
VCDCLGCACNEKRVPFSIQSHSCRGQETEHSCRNGSAMTTRVDAHSTSPEAVDEWSDGVVGRIQRAADLVPLFDGDDLRAAIRTLIDELRPPRNQCETVILRTLLSDFASAAGCDLHRREHRERRRRRCPLAPAMILESCWSRRAEDPRRLLGAWADTFFRALAIAHPPAIAVRAASLLRAEYDRGWTAASLSRRLGTSEGALRESFRREFTISVHDYLRIARVRAALQSVTAHKVAVVSLDAGYRSRKNFYWALQQFTGLTPTEFRELSAARAVEVMDSLTLLLARKP